MGSVWRAWRTPTLPTARQRPPMQRPTSPTTTDCVGRPMAGRQQTAPPQLRHSKDTCTKPHAEQQAAEGHAANKRLLRSDDDKSQHHHAAAAAASPPPPPPPSPPPPPPPPPPHPPLPPPDLCHLSEARGCACAERARPERECVVYWYLIQ